VLSAEPKPRITLPLTGTATPAHSALGTQHSALIDSFGRAHTRLRVSVTDRCNLRCTYCMPAEVEFRDRAELLSFEELARVVRVAAGLGVTRVRLTGGEPTLRRGLPDLVRLVVATPGVKDVGLTTNGLLLEQLAEPLWAAGLRRLNVSLDTLDPGRFRQLARRDGLDRVLAGLAAAKRVGFEVKVNAVALRGFVEHDAGPLALYCRAHGFELRFIESMPIGAEPWERDQAVLADELLALVGAACGKLVPAAAIDPSAPAAEHEYAVGGGRVGVIASVSRPFCAACDRLRLTADGQLRNCLFSTDETDVKGVLRGGGTDADVADRLRACVWGKAAGHGFNAAGWVKPGRTMHAIGG
jgi:cyclic pyranopterin phosphate synthase